MKQLIASIFLLLMGCSLKPQQWQDFTPTGYNDAFFSSVSFINEKEGWVIARPEWPGNYDLLYTSDGAQSFEKLFSLPDGMECWKLQMIDSLYGYAKIEYSANYENYFWKTTDGGLTWQDITDTSLFNIGGDLYSSRTFFFTDRNNGCFGGHKSIYKTMDGGINWQRMNTPQVIDSLYVNSSYKPNALYFIDNQYGWAACTLYWDAGFGMKTTDGGVNWTVCTPITGDLWDVNFVDSLTGGMVMSGSFSADILLTHDNFNTKPIYSAPTNQSPSILRYQSRDTLWVSGVPPIINRSTDGGLTYQEYDTSYASIHPNAYVHDIRFFGQTGYTTTSTSILKLVDTLNTSSRSMAIANEALLISPNPARDNCTITVTLQNSGYSSLEIYTLSGMLLEKKMKYLKAGRNEILLDTSILKSGIYIIHLKSDTHQFINKLIKM